jgi:hypothetical protein
LNAISIHDRQSLSNSLTTVRKYLRVLRVSVVNSLFL